MVVYSTKYCNNGISVLNRPMRQIYSLIVDDKKIWPYCLEPILVDICDIGLIYIADTLASMVHRFVLSTFNLQNKFGFNFNT